MGLTAALTIGIGNAAVRANARDWSLSDLRARLQQPQCGEALAVGGNGGDGGNAPAKGGNGGGILSLLG